MILISCSPYDNTSSELNFRLTSACGAVNNGSSDIDCFDLSWYWRRSRDGMVENSGPGTTDKQKIGDSTRIVLSGVIGLSDAPFSEEMLGEYWCQAVVTNRSGQYLAYKSNVLTVLRSESYSGFTVCSSV